MGKSIFDTLAAPISAPLDAAGGVVHGIGNALGDIPVIGGAAKYGGIGLSDALHSEADFAKGNVSKAANDTLSSFSNAIHGPNTIPVVGKYILPAVASIWGGPLGYGAANAIQNGFEASRNGASFGDASKYGSTSGALSAAGSYAGSQLLGPTLNGLGGGVNPASGGATAGSLGTPFSQSLGETSLSGVGNALGSTTPGDVLASGVGSSIGSSMAGPSPTAPVQAQSPWAPSQMAQMDLPSSLSSYQNLDPMQQATNIASKGVYGGGQGPQEKNYFLNLINRQLVNSGGQVAGDTSSINPVENSFLSQLGLGGYKNPTDLLKNISQYS